MLTTLFLNMLNREAASPKRKAREIIAKLALEQGQTVADIGSGGGYFSLAFARLVGPEGRVFAVDSNPKHVAFIQKEIQNQNITNVQTVTAPATGAIALPQGATDLVFARSVFHHLDEPAQFFRTLKPALAPDGIVAIIDYLPSNGCNFVSLFKHYTPLETIQSAMRDAGYHLRQSFDFLQGQSFTLWTAGQ